VTAVITLSACPAMALPCGFDQFGRPVGLQLVGKPRGEAMLLQAAALFEELLRLNRAPADRSQTGFRPTHNLTTTTGPPWPVIPGYIAWRTSVAWDDRGQRQ
jgi:hypothetical protein